MFLVNSLKFSNISVEKPNSLKEKCIFSKKKAVGDFPLFLAFEIPCLPFSLPQIALTFSLSQIVFGTLQLKWEKTEEERLRVLLIFFYHWKCSSHLCFGRSPRWKIKSYFRKPILPYLRWRHGHFCISGTEEEVIDAMRGQMTNLNPPLASYCLIYRNQSYSCFILQ